MKVVILTPTYNRRFAWEFERFCVAHQTFPRESLHWIILDNSDDPAKDWSPAKEEKELSVEYHKVDGKKPIGWLRNRLLEYAQAHAPDYVAFWDDDDYYVPQRIQASVEALQKDSSKQIVGCPKMTIFLAPQNALVEVGPYGENHATCASYLFVGSLLGKHWFPDDAVKAEEAAFTRNWTTPMAMLDCKDIILVIGHAHNTVNKSQILDDPRTFMANILNVDNAKHLIRFQWLKTPGLWGLFCKTFLPVVEGRV
jgi:glycosyltransferase involved in cell wall biosynthesis